MLKLIANHEVGPTSIMLPIERGPPYFLDTSLKSKLTEAR